MVTVMINIDDEVYEVLKVLAKQQNVGVDEILRTITIEDLARIKSRLHHPAIGVFDSGRTDVSERDEEIMYGRKDT